MYGPRHEVVLLVRIVGVDTDGETPAESAELQRYLVEHGVNSCHLHGSSGHGTVELVSFTDGTTGAVTTAQPAATPVAAALRSKDQLMLGLRSLVFTALLQEREFGRLESRDGERVVTDATERVQKEMRVNPSTKEFTVQAIMKRYVADVTANSTTEPGVWQRYADTLKAGDERASAPEPAIRTPKAAREALGDTTTQSELLDFASDSTRFDGDIVDLF